VVLPFANLSSDPEQEYFVDAITDDLTTDLSRIVNSFVISRTTAFTYKGKAIDVKQIGIDLGVRYVLEGSVRRLGEQVQVNVQLIDAESGSHIWADRFDTDRANLAKAQSEITSRLARTLKLELLEAVGRRIEQDNPGNLDASDWVMRGWFLFYRPLSPANLQEAQRAFERALEIDLGSFTARVGIATILNERIPLGWSQSREQDMARSEQLLREAFERDRNDSWALSELGRLRRLQGRLIEAQIELEKAVARDPNNTRAILQSGITLIYLGRPEAALPHIEKSLQLNPTYQNVFYRYFWSGYCHLLLTHADEAVDFFRKTIAAATQRESFHLVLLAAALGLRGDVDEARTSLAEALKLRPEVNSIARVRAASGPNQSNPLFAALCEKTVFAGLRRAGMPDA
jgi:adenylate cyclase